MKILVATGNEGKLEEFRRILKPLSIEVLSPKDLGITVDVEETGETFKENARLKAEELFKKTGLPTVADDSGMCIDAIDGRPGVKTARYGGVGADYTTKIKFLLEEMKNVPKEDRTAYFVCNICCIMEQDTRIETVGSCKGWIGFEPDGVGGFGFDPIFYIEKEAIANYSNEHKDAISHRGIALREFVKQLKNYFKNRGETL